MSDYESDSCGDFSVKAVPAPTKPKKQQASKRKAPDSASAGNSGSKTKSSKKRSGSDLFDLEGDIEHRVTTKGADNLTSSLVSRVANGKVRRTVDLDGDFFIDLKVYHKGDIASTRPEDRWKKATVALKLQLDKDTHPWNELHSFMRRAHELFKDSEPVFYNDKI